MKMIVFTEMTTIRKGAYVHVTGAFRLQAGISMLCLNKRIQWLLCC